MVRIDTKTPSDDVVTLLEHRRMVFSLYHEVYRKCPMGDSQREA